ncbi:MAG: ABC transporter ATP-binding protein [Candidatus Borkfalkiaceae bacterium]|nr:ABC transporter ATP-binding protein [Christensenellaceae bacterium]
MAGMRRKVDMTKAPAKKGTFKRLIKYVFKHYNKQLIAVFVCLIVSAAGGLVSSLFMQKNIDLMVEGVEGGGYQVIKETLLRYISTMGILYFTAVLSNFIYSRIMATVTQGLLYDFRKEMFEKMQTLPVKYFDTHAHGEIMSTYTNDTDALRQLIGQSIPTMFSSILTLVIVIGTMLYFSVYMTLVFFLSSVVTFYIVKVIGGRSSKHMVAQQISLAKEEGFVEEMMKGQKVIKVFTHEEESKSDFDKLNEELFVNAKEAHVYGNILGPIVGNVGNFTYVFMTIFGAFLLFSGIPNLSFMGIFQGAITPITLSLIIPFLGMSRRSTQAVNEMSQQVTMIAMGLAGASRIFELLDQEPEQDEGYVKLVNCNIDENGVITESPVRTGRWAWKHPHKADGTVTYTELKGDIQLFDVDFGYTPEKIVLHDISIHAEPGQKIALVGATGAGKTTITNLLNRFYDIADGKIRYDGININKIKKADLRRSLGIVLQDTNLFTGTVMDNIRYGRLDATDEECVAAAKLANAHDFITRLPEGYNTMLNNNGANLSQGQRQLLSIARVAVANTPAMILDEATSSIDTRTEALVQDGMDKLMEGRTVFVIAHRLSTVRNSDVIMVLSHGEIIERGTHEELIAKRGQYYQLYTGAFELE